jgi:signal transduction histidine kinase
MVERAELTGGHCRINSELGEGTTVEVWLPLDAEAEKLGTRLPASPF